MTESVFGFTGGASLTVSSYWSTVRITGNKILGRNVNGARYRMKVRALQGDENATCGLWLETGGGSVIITDAVAPVSCEADPELPSSWIILTYEGSYSLMDSSQTFTEAFDGQAELKITNPLVSDFSQGMAVLLEMYVFVSASDVWEAVVYDAGEWLKCTTFAYAGNGWQKQSLSCYNGTDW